MKSIHLLLLLLISAMTARSQPSEKPNFLIFIGDDHGFYHSSPYGSPEYRTPNLQAMADEGIQFNNAYVASPACGPSRASFFTGMMPLRNGIVGNHETELNPGIESLVPYLLEQGYDIAFRGKVAHGAIKHHYGYIPEAITILPGRNRPNMQVESITPYLRNRPDKTKPVALFVGCTYTHRAWPKKAKAHITPDIVQLPPKTFATPEARGDMMRYMEAVEQLDGIIGRVRNMTKNFMPPENTLVLYTSDHGQAWPFGKWSLYETGLRTPILAVWPEKIPAKIQTDAIVSWIDIMPTLIDLAGGQVPENLDGRSFKDVLFGQTDTFRKVLFASHKGDKGKNVYPIRSVRVGDWKYIKNLHPEFKNTTHVDLAKEGEISYTPGYNSWVEAAKTNAEAAAFLADYHSNPAEELYNITKDPYEKVNLAASPEYAEKLKELRALVEQRMIDLNDDQSLSGEPRLLEDYPLPSTSE